MGRKLHSLPRQHATLAPAFTNRLRTCHHSRIAARRRKSRSRPISRGGGKLEKIETTTRSAFSDDCDAREVANHPSATNEERIAAAHIMAATTCRAASRLVRHLREEPRHSAIERGDDEHGDRDERADDLQQSTDHGDSSAASASRLSIRPGSLLPPPQTHFRSSSCASSHSFAWTFRRSVLAL